MIHPDAPPATPTPAASSADLQERTTQVRARQHSRAAVVAVLLGAFVILIFAITIVKIKAGMPH